MHCLASRPSVWPCSSILKVSMCHVDFFHSPYLYPKMEAYEDFDAGDSANNDPDWDYNDDEDGSTRVGTKFTLESPL